MRSTILTEMTGENLRRLLNHLRLGRFIHLGLSFGICISMPDHFISAPTNAVDDLDRNDWRESPSPSESSPSRSVHSSRIVVRNLYIHARPLHLCADECGRRS